MTRRQLPLVLTATLPFSSTARANEAEEILSLVEQSYGNLRSYQFEGRSSYETTHGKAVSRTEFRFRSAYTAPNKLRSEIHYPNSGVWLRVADGEWFLEVLPLGGRVRREPWKPEPRRAFDGSPVYNFERLPALAEAPQCLRTETVEAGGQRTSCKLLQFTPKQGAFRNGVVARTAFVWIDITRWIVLKEEIRTSQNLRGIVQNSRKTVVIENFRLNEPLPEDLFSTKLQDGT